MSLDSINVATFYYGTAVIVLIGVVLMLVGEVICRAKVEHQARPLYLATPQLVPVLRHRASMQSRGRRKTYRAV